MIRHIVLSKLSPSADASETEAVWSGLAALSAALPGAKGFAGGRSDSPEQMERGYTHGFTIDFESWDALAHYAEHPDHKALGARLVALTQGGVEGLLVMDIEV